MSDLLTGLILGVCLAAVVTVLSHLLDPSRRRPRR